MVNDNKSRNLRMMKVRKSWTYEGSFWVKVPWEGNENLLELNLSWLFGLFGEHKLLKLELCLGRDNLLGSWFFCLSSSGVFRFHDFYEELSNHPIVFWLQEFKNIDRVKIKNF